MLGCLGLKTKLPIPHEYPENLLEPPHQEPGSHSGVELLHATVQVIKTVQPIAFCGSAENEHLQHAIATVPPLVSLFHLHNRLDTKVGRP